MGKWTLWFKKFMGIILLFKSDAGGISPGFGCVHSVGGGVGLWTFTGPRGGVAESYTGRSNQVGGVAV